MPIVRIGFGALFWVLGLMTQIPPDHATGALAGWFREGGLPAIADRLDSPVIDHLIRHDAVWVLFSIGTACLAWPLIINTGQRLFRRKTTAVAQPDMKVSDAIDYIVNDSKTAFNEPYRPEPPPDFLSARMQVVDTLHSQAQRQLSGKINIGDVKAWGLREVTTRGPNKFESALRVIPLTYWDDMQVDFHGARYDRRPHFQTKPVLDRTTTYNWTDIKVSRSQIEAFWPKKFIVVRLYNKILNRRVSYASEFNGI